MACVGCPVIPVKIALILSNLVVIYLILLFVVFILIILLLYLIFIAKKKTKRKENDPQVGVVGHLKKLKIKIKSIPQRGCGI